MKKCCRANNYFTMWTVSFLVILCLNIYANCELLSDVDKKLLRENARNNEARSDIETKMENARNYLSSLSKEKENWVDPYDMIPSPLDEIHSESLIKSGHIESIVNEPNGEFDFRPLFSDIKGEVINSKSIPRDDSGEYVAKTDGNLFSNGRHQICVLDSIYISRWLKKLISRIESDSELEPTALTIPLDSESLIELKAMSNAKTLEIADLDDVICKLITKSTILRREAYDWAGIRNWLVIIVIFFCGGLVVSYILYLCVITSPGYTLVICFLIINVFWHWMHLYQKQIAAKHSVLSTMQIPSGCHKVELGLFEQIQVYFKSFFETGDCLKYYEALMVDPIWGVSLSVAVSETFTATLFQPLYSASKALNAAVKILFADLSFLNVLILFVFLLIFIIMFCGYKLKLPFFMGSLEPGNVVHNYVEEVKSVQKQHTFSKLKIKSCKVLQNIRGSTSNAITSSPSGFTSMCKNDNITMFSSNDLPLENCCHSLIKRHSAKESKDCSDLSETFPRNSEESLPVICAKRSDNSCEDKTKNCHCDLGENVTVDQTKVVKHNECECEIKTFDCDDQIYDSHIEVEDFDHDCAKCERYSLKQLSRNHEGCAECGKNDPD